MKIDSDYKDGRLTVKLNGELDHHGARLAMSAINEHIDLNLPRDCVLDLSGLSFMDSSGIAVVLKTYKSMKELGGRTWVKNVPRQPMKVLNASGIERIVSISALVN
ncbi:MAG: STAS domain-containing protein [Ruminococcaceae bacterium]|nr:STAS domain-containing protein [Oscillospiraceae bacterium]